MRWFARRLGFYVFALWVALTINFLLPGSFETDRLESNMQSVASHHSADTAAPSSSRHGPTRANSAMAVSRLR